MWNFGMKNKKLYQPYEPKKQNKRRTGELVCHMKWKISG